MLSSAAGLPAQASEPEGPIRYSAEARNDPRPLRLHWLSIDLRAEGYELAVAMGEDPDGEGPIEATLTPPQKLAERELFLAAVNTNAWVMMPDPQTGETAGYVAGGYADVSGWVQTLDGVRSPPQAGYWSLWQDEDGRVRVGNPHEPPAAKWAVSGFRGLLKDGEILPRPSDVRHSRTAAGVNRSGRRLTLLVVDGRRAGYSEGVSERELAELLLEAGCRDALNLDGGGSSVMLLGDGPGELTVMNRPSGAFGPRPVPVMLGVRQQAAVLEPAR